MESRKTLYLFEVTVEKVVIDPETLLESFTFDPASIHKLHVVVKIKFSDFLKIDIEGEATLGMNFMEEECLISGKSCIFPMLGKQMESEMQKSPMYVEVFTLTDGDGTPILLGKTKIDLAPFFLSTVSRGNFLANSPTSNSILTNENLSNIFGQVCGKLKVSLRFSSLGYAFLNDLKSPNFQFNEHNFHQDPCLC